MLKMENREKKKVKKIWIIIPAVIVVLAIAAGIVLSSMMKGRIPRDKLLEILDDEIGAQQISMDGLNTIDDILNLDSDMLANGVYITESVEDIEERYGDEVALLVAFADEKFDVDIDTSVIDNATLFVRKTPDNTHVTVVTHFQFESRHAANTIVQGIIASARAGGRIGIDRESVSASDIKKITKDELYYNLISRGHILMHLDKRFIRDMAENALADYLRDNVESDNILFQLGERTGIRRTIMTYLNDHYGQYLDAEAAIGIYYEYDSLMLITEYSTDAEFDDTEAICGETGLGNPAEAENSDLILEFARSFFEDRVKEIIGVAVDYVKEHWLEILGSLL